jgi:lysophospholipase L1-like esterase
MEKFICQPSHLIKALAVALVLPIFELPLKSAEPAASGEEPRTNVVAAKSAAVDWAAVFKMHWQNRVRAFQEQNQTWQNVVLLGDSITEGFDVTKYFPGRRILNRGIGADVIGNAMPPDDPRGVLRRLDNSVFDCAATDLFILIGINDLNSGRTVSTMESGYRELLQKVRQKRPDLLIFVESVLPTQGEHAKQNAFVLQFNESLKRMAAEFGCSYLDLHSLLRDGDGLLKAEFTNDGLHLTEPAYQIWRQQILEALKWN